MRCKIHLIESFCKAGLQVAIMIFIKASQFSLIPRNIMSTVSNIVSCGMSWSVCRIGGILEISIHGPARCRNVDKAC